MLSRCRHLPSPLTRRRIITGVALLAYVASVTGYPLPLPAVEQDTSVAYPCQSHACGCNSAAQCWDSCCCYTAAERLDWIHSHGVVVPTATLAALQAEAAQDEEGSHSCCHRSEPASKPACGACGTAGNCAHKSNQHDRGQASSTETKARIVWVNGIQAQKCQGLTTLWLVSGANLPVEIRTLWEFSWTLAGRVQITDDQLFFHGDLPPVPPPRITPTNA